MSCNEVYYKLTNGLAGVAGGFFLLVSTTTYCNIHIVLGGGGVYVRGYVHVKKANTTYVQYVVPPVSLFNYMY